MGHRMDGNLGLTGTRALNIRLKNLRMQNLRLF